MVMIAETVSLGVLSLPSALSTLGLIPGLSLLVGLGLIASYTGHIIGRFKLRHPHVHSMGDAGHVLFGRIGGEIFGIGQLLFMVFIMASHLLTFSIAMNALSSHITCTMIFVAAGAVLSFVLTIPRTLQNLSWWSITSFISIIAAVMVTMIGVSLQPPADGHSRSDVILLWPSPATPFHTAFLAVANIVFAYAGHVAFFTFISELRKPEEFPKALGLLQGCDILIYIVSSIFIYLYAGRHVRSPALDSAGTVVRKIAYGLAIPTIVVAGVVNGHVAVKYIYVRLLRDKPDFSKHDDSRNRTTGEQEIQDKEASGKSDGSKLEAAIALDPKESRQDEPNLMYQTTFKARGIWVGLNASLWLLAWLIAEGVPVFNDLLGLTSALFASWFTFGLSGFFWFDVHRPSGGWKTLWQQPKPKEKSWKKIPGCFAATGLILLGLSLVSLPEMFFSHFSPSFPASFPPRSSHTGLVSLKRILSAVLSAIFIDPAPSHHPAHAFHS